MAEGIACYKTFISGLLDITDNLRATARPSRRERVVRHDGDDTYLVVAADKGTATFSDIANGVAKDYGFWLGDAFASGGSVGYDHKAMGITARGAWESVRRHFREMGVDCQNEDFTCVGIGDMSGDVFGNGMLLSRAHPAGRGLRPPRHLPRPDPDAGDVVRRAQAALRRCRARAGRTTTPALISEGGGVFSAALKSIPITPQVREALGARRRRHGDDAGRADAGDPARRRSTCSGTAASAPTSRRRPRPTPRSATRPTTRSGSTAASCAAKCVGEGGNLGLTQRGRIEYARRARWPDQHRLHRQLRRRGHLRPRGEHQDPARPGGGRRRPDREAAQRPAGLDDRRGRRRWCWPTTTSRTSRWPTPRSRRRRCCTCTRTGCGGSSGRGCSTASSRRCRRRKAGRDAARARRRG